MSKGKRKHTPACRIPVSMADMNREVDKATNDACRLSTIIFLSVLLDKEGFDKESLQRVWSEIEDRSESIKKNLASLRDWERVLKDEYEIEVFKSR